MKTLFDSRRLSLEDAIRQTAQLLGEYVQRYRHWAIAFSGGKDSSAALTVIVYLIESGQVPRPKSLTVLYADTRMELPPLQISAEAILDSLRKRGMDARTVLPALDERFWVYMLGRGVPPPKNRFRWCTPQLKIEPMQAALGDVRRAAGEKVLMLTGVRIGESAARDQTIAVSCGRDGAECGQGWLHLSPDQKATGNINQYFVPSPPEGVTDTLAPILHWRICHVWEWLTRHAPDGGFPTTYLIADAYGGRDDLESLIDSNARTGCVCCPLASRDTALDRLLKTAAWSYLAPLKRLRDLWLMLWDFGSRLQKHGETKKDGTLSSSPCRKGPLTMDARCRGLGTVLAIQAEVNRRAARLGRPLVSLIDREELARITELQAANTWPNGWTGDEPDGDLLLPNINRDGTIQGLLFGDEFPEVPTHA